jgi:hypothetical protein
MMNEINKNTMELFDNKFMVMAGVKNMSYDNKKNSICFKLAKINGVKINTVEVIYDANLDLYNIVFSRLNKTEYTIIENVAGIYADNVLPTFEKVTGLKTRLF